MGEGLSQQAVQRAVRYQLACLAEHIWIRNDDPQVNVYRRHDTALELEFPKFDSLQEA